MPVEFLSDDHLKRYGHFQGDPTPEQLARHFVLTPGDLAVMVDLRHDHTRLGFALQLCSLRFLGTFLIEPLEVPALVVRTLCDQLGLQGTQNLPRYLERRATRFEHQLIIRDHLQYRDFVGAALLDYLRWLHARVRVGDERPTLLFDLSITYLNTQRVILPGATTLARVIVKFREQAAQQLYVQLERRLSDAQKAALERYLVVPEGERRTPYERLRFPPSNTSHLGLNTALERILSICEVGVSDVNVADLPAVRMAALSRHAEKTSTRVLIKLAQTRRHATLLCYLQHLERSATDDALTIFDNLMNSWRLTSERQHQKKRLRTLSDLDDAVLLMAEVVDILFEDAVLDSDVRKVTFKRFNKETLLAVKQRARELATPPERRESERWKNALGNVARFFPRLIATLSFEGTPTATALMSALQFLQEPEERRKRSWKQAPRVFVPKSWETAVFPLSREGEPDKTLYQLCVAHRLHLALKGRQVFVPRSTKFGDTRAQLLTFEQFETVKEEVSRSLQLSTQPLPFLEQLSTHLHSYYQEVLARLPTNPYVRIEVKEGETLINLKALEKQADSESLDVLNDLVEPRMPHLDLPEVILEIHAATGCLDAFDLASEGNTRAKDMHRSIAAVLIAQACNIGLKAVSQLGSSALNLHRLAWVQQNYFRPETLERANVRLVDAQAQLELAQKWGGGEADRPARCRFVQDSCLCRWNAFCGSCPQYLHRL